MTSLAISLVNLRRLMRDRIALFFVFVFPIILILLLGLSFGGGFIPRLGVVAHDRAPLAGDVLRELGRSRDVDIEYFEDSGSLVDAVQRGVVEGGLVIPRDYDRELRVGRDVELEYVARAGDVGGALRTVVDAAVTRQAALVRAARFAEAQNGVNFGDALRNARLVGAAAPGIEVDVRTAGHAQEEEVGRFDMGAATQLVLFIFLNSLAASAALVQTRRLGLSRRMLAAPTTSGRVLLGEAGGRFLVAMLQAVIIIVAARLLFGVDWGDPLGAAGIVIAFSLVSTGVAMAFGSILSNEQQANALVPLGLILAALGGCMVPLEVFSPTMQRIAHITPHAWAVDGFTKLIAADATAADVLPQIGVLALFAAVLLALGSWGLRRSITA